VYPLGGPEEKAKAREVDRRSRSRARPGLSRGRAFMVLLLEDGLSLGGHIILEMRSKYHRKNAITYMLTAV
jgi:hypothetical protein